MCNSQHTDKHTAAVTTVYTSFIQYMLSHRKKFAQLSNVKNTHITIHTPQRYTAIDTQPLQSVSTLSHETKSTFKNMSTGQLQLALGKTLSASTNLKPPKPRFWDPLLMSINTPTFISITLLLYFSFQPDWCKLLWLGVLYVWSRCQSGLMPALSLLLS